MPAEVSNRIVPRSILRHRPITPEITDAYISGSSGALTTTCTRRRSTRTHYADHTHTSSDIPAWVRTSRRFARRKSSPPTAGIGRYPLFTLHPSTSLLVMIGCGMSIALILILLGQMLVSGMTTMQDDWRYGFPRTYQTDMYVGHEQTGQPSHFIAINNRGRIEIIELPGNDPAHTRIFLGPQLSGNNTQSIPVTLQFIDTQHNHHPDMLVHIQQSTIIFHNNGNTFEPPQ
jgi:hypothetical protein